jgi:hypothetical protein
MVLERFAKPSSHESGFLSSSLSRSAKFLGLKVFMDAHSTVTAEEGDRYPLRPPSLCIHSVMATPESPKFQF